MIFYFRFTLVASFTAKSKFFMELGKKDLLGRVTSSGKKSTMKLQQLGTVLLLWAVAMAPGAYSANMVFNINMATTGPTTYTPYMSDWYYFSEAACCFSLDCLQGPGLLHQLGLQLPTIQ